MAQDALGDAGVRRVWAGAGLQRAAYRGGGISCGLAHSLSLPPRRLCFWHLLVCLLAGSLKPLSTNSDELFSEGDVCLSGKKTISVLIRMQEFLTEFYRCGM